jgi:hypothetical protein
MDKPVFDGAAFVSIDLKNGRVATKGDDQMVLVPAEILSMMPVSDALKRAAFSWGERHGRVLREKIDTRHATVEILSSYLAGSLAVFGLGRVLLEVRHSALMFRLVGAETEGGSEGKSALISGFISGYLQAVSGHPFSVLDIGSQGKDRLFWAGNPKAVSHVERDVGQGTLPLAAIDALTTGGVTC